MDSATSLNIIDDNWTDTLDALETVTMVKLNNSRVLAAVIPTLRVWSPDSIARLDGWPELNILIFPHCT